MDVQSYKNRPVRKLHIITCNNPLVALDVELLWLVPAEEIPDFLVVDLHVGDMDRVDRVSVLLPLLALEHVDDGSRDDPNVI